MKNYEKKIIFFKDDINYPSNLKVINKPPKKIHIIGNIDILKMPSIAIVGSRNYSEYGRKMTEIFTKELVSNGFIIVSGMADGIDFFAHKTCINYRRKNNCCNCRWARLCI